MTAWATPATRASTWMEMDSAIPTFHPTYAPWITARHSPIQGNATWTVMAAAVAGQRFVELFERSEKQVAHAVSHVHLVGDGERQGPGPRADPGVERHLDRHVAPAQMLLFPRANSSRR